MSGLVVEVLFKGRLLRAQPFDRPVLRVGRMRENDVVIDNLAVSRFHARLHVVEGRVFFEDDGSENGSFVNGARVHGRVELGPGDLVAIGKHQLRVRSTAAGATPPEPRVPGPEPRRSDAWDAMQTYFAGPETRAQLRGASAPGADPAPAAASPPEEREPMRSESVPSLADVLPDAAPDHDLAPAPAAAPSRELAPPLHAGLIVQRSGKIERIVPWDGDALTVGRASECELVLPQDEVSRRHARLVRVGDRYEVCDLGSVNGTLVNGRRVDRHVLAVGDVIAIESFELTFVLDREPITGVMKPAPPPAGPREHDSLAMTILQEEMIPLDEAAPVATLAPALAADPLPELDLLSDVDDAEGFDERKQQAALRPRGSSRASSVQDLGRISSPERALVIELRVRAEELPEPLRRALAEVEGDALVLPAELRLRRAD